MRLAAALVIVMAAFRGFAVRLLLVAGAIWDTSVAEVNALCAPASP